MADTQPLNLARIVHRLLVQPEGWAVEALRAELGISARTYRKYRRNLTLRFEPWLEADGRSRLEEVEDAEGRRVLRLRPADGGGTAPGRG